VDVSLPWFAVSAGIVLGKLPFHGDFVARGVSGAVRDEIDRWLVDSMATARDELGPRFEEAFDSALPWRFAWHDERWTAGALVPSVDSAGRRFPLLVARTNLERDEVETAAQLCEEVAAEAISERWQADKLVEAVEALETVHTASRGREGWWNDEVGEAGKLEDQRPRTILSHMLSTVAAQ
jgi:type VI secretion system ImpM family protein